MRLERLDEKSAVDHWLKTGVINADQAKLLRAIDSQRIIDELNAT
jgi:hypothetical protein